MIKELLRPFEKAIRNFPVCTLGAEGSCHLRGYGKLWHSCMQAHNGALVGGALRSPTLSVFWSIHWKLPWDKLCIYIGRLLICKYLGISVDTLKTIFGQKHYSMVYRKESLRIQVVQNRRTFIQYESSTLHNLDKWHCIAHPRVVVWKSVCWCYIYRHKAAHTRKFHAAIHVF